MDKKKKLMCREKNKDKEEVDGGDRISSLGDDILHHILSFLPAHYAVPTCILSKTWRNMWTGIPKLDLCADMYYDDREETKVEFMDFVEKVLLRHDTTVIKEFNFIGNDSDEGPRIEEVLSTLLKQKLEKLKFCIYEAGSVIFPASLYICKSLTVMEIIGTSTLILPESVCYPNLKVLHLESIYICCENEFVQVSFILPVVKNLKLIDCDWYQFKGIDIFAPLLESVMIEDEWGHDNAYSDHEIKISSESLVTLDIRSCLPYNYSFCNLSSLHEATIDRSMEDYEHSSRVSRFVQGIICNVKELELSSKTIRTMSCLKDLLAVPNLDKVIIESCGLRVKYLTRIFCSLLHIKSLVFIHGLRESSDNGGYDWTLAEIPQSFLSQLKSFEIRHFQGNETELSLVVFLMKNARAIEIITIVFSPNLGPEKKLEVMKRLSLHHRASTSGVLNIS